MVLQRVIRFYEERLGRKINEAEQEAVRAMCEELRRLKAPGGGMAYAVRLGAEKEKE
ncbi:hypothetical protein MYX64_08340 [Nitrospinae bacterium AH_259_B05_G02_I21]|nr:hypothetical protein [Nitrospinae bacterium AH_259_B05_G02_I21]MDA2931670.1 hypothetical protein [Nitrospinae bacterium AH-259-F20]